MATVLLEALDVYQPGRGEFSTILFWLLPRRLVDCFRTQSRRPQFEPFPTDFDPPSLGPFSYVDRDALDAALASAWRQLDLIEQRVMWLHFVVGFTYLEIGQQLDFVGCPLRQSSLRSRVFRACAKLRPYLLPFDDISEDELIEAVHRASLAAGTFLFPPSRQRRNRRLSRRRAAARRRCARRHAGKKSSDHAQQATP